ncbi:aminotransferase class III-fold pyridoxal phosphate-dependent enzyme [Stutzerimonas nitrititolerans]|uniref:aminotransferase class III-fold pyridoxal phosphate-dependent enzyme n=1 Tax=Stutzerimonas nitrititolerans TaxID=2482751 RepID=UPI0035E3FE6B
MPCGGLCNSARVPYSCAGAWFGYQRAGIAPDVLTLAKALGNGFPIGACLARGQAADLFSPGQHGSTFGGNPLACPVLNIMARDNLPARVAVLGDRLLAGLQKALGDLPDVIAIRGQGLMAGIELNRPCQGLVIRALGRTAPAHYRNPRHHHPLAAAADLRRSADRRDRGASLSPLVFYSAEIAPAAIAITSRKPATHMKPEPTHSFRSDLFELQKKTSYIYQG